MNMGNGCCKDWIGSDRIFRGKEVQSVGRLLLGCCCIAVCLSIVVRVPTDETTKPSSGSVFVFLFFCLLKLATLLHFVILLSCCNDGMMECHIHLLILESNANAHNGSP